MKSFFRKVISKWRNGNSRGGQGQGQSHSNDTTKGTSTSTSTSTSTARNHFLFHNLHSNNLSIRQSCIVTLLQGVERAQIDQVAEKLDWKLQMESTRTRTTACTLKSKGKLKDDEDDKDGGGGRVEILRDGQEDEGDGTCTSSGSKKGFVETSKSSKSTATTTTKTTTTTMSKKIMFNYKTILRHVIWDMVQDDFQSFLRLSYSTLGMGMSMSTSTSTNDAFQLPFMTGTGDSGNSGSNSGSNSKGIVQLVGLFIYLLEDCDDHDDNRCYYYCCNENDNEDGTGSGDNDNTTTDGKNVDMDISMSTPKKMDAEPDRSSPPPEDANSNPTKNNHRDDGKSPLYQFVVKGGLKWISEMILHLIQLLLSFNNFNLNQYTYSNPALEYYQSNNNNNNNNSNDSDNDNPLATMEFSSPSTLNKPRHYFHSLKQSSTVVLSNPTLERDILVRLSLLIDLFMRISFVGYLYPVSTTTSASTSSGDEAGNTNTNEGSSTAAAAVTPSSGNNAAEAAKGGSFSNNNSSNGRKRKMSKHKSKLKALRKSLGRLSKKHQQQQQQHQQQSQRNESSGNASGNTTSNSNSNDNNANSSYNDRNNNTSTNRDGDGDEVMADVDEQLQGGVRDEENAEEDISSFLRAITSMKTESSTNNNNNNNETPASAIDVDLSNVKSTTTNIASTTTSRRPNKKKVKTDKERHNQRVQVLQNIHQYVWRQSNIDSTVYLNANNSNTTSSSVSKLASSLSSENPESLVQISPIQSTCTLSPLASLLTASFVLSTTTPPPTPSPSSSSGGARSFHSLSLLTTSLMSGIIPTGGRFRSPSGGSVNATGASVDKMPLFSGDYPILPGQVRTERIVSYLNKLTDPMKDATVLMKQKEIGSSSGNTKNNKGQGSHSNKGGAAGNDKKRKSMGSASKRKKPKTRSDDNNSSLESALVRSGKRRRLDVSSSIADRAPQRLNSSSEQNEMQRDEEEMSSSTARAILRAVVVGDRGSGRSSEISPSNPAPCHPFSLPVERGMPDSVAELMARDMMESLLERRSAEGGTNRIETGGSSGICPSSLDDARFINVDLLDGAPGTEIEQKTDSNNNETGKESNDNNKEEVDNNIEVDDDDDDDDDDENMDDDDLIEDEDDDEHEMELVAGDEDEEIDSDLEEQHKPMFGTIQDVVEDDAIVENIIVDEGGPFEVDEDDIMLVDGFESVRGLHSADQILRVINTSAPSHTRRRNDNSGSGGSGGSSPGSSASNDKSKDWRKRALIRAGMEVLEVQYPPLHNNCLPSHRESTDSFSVHRLDIMQRKQKVLTPSAEQSLVQSICDIVKPPKKPLNLKVFMRRAPTQEEFFRGNVSRNPILISSLKVEQGSSSPSNTGSSSSDNNEPRVRDLRQHIANDLQMSESAELLELLVANKILDMNLKLRVISQTLWKTYLMENASASQSESSSIRHLISSGFDSESRSRIDENTPVSSLPPMVVTYRLAGVDGEATEDNVEVGDLVDPEAPPDTDTSKAEYEKQMEKEFGLTRLSTKGRGVHVLLRSIEAYIGEILQNIRRDDVGRRRLLSGTEVLTKNSSRDSFLKSTPCPSLILLRHCARLKDNRKKLVNAKAPTILLRLLLEVLNSIDESAAMKDFVTQPLAIETSDENGEDTNNNNGVSENLPKQSNKPIGNNPTADLLQELIETLASDISTTESKSTNEKEKEGMETETSDNEDNEDSEGSTLPMVLSSLTTTSLSPPLRKVIAKLLPFLTYGQISQSKALARHFVSHINFECLRQGDVTTDDSGDSKSVLMDTFVDAAIHLPPEPVCDTLRSELIREGFVSNLKIFLMREIPGTPPPWSSALFPKNSKASTSEDDKQTKESLWQIFYSRNGLQTGFRILIGLCKEHVETQSHVAEEKDESQAVQVSFLTSCHWIESTSDNSVAEISTNGLGILAETLLDTLSQGNKACEDKINELRKRTRDRKKEIAQERRSKALVNMSAFGRLAGDGAKKTGKSNEGPEPSFGGVFSALSNAFSGRTKQGEPTPKDSSSNTAENKIVDTKQKTEESKPAWMLEMEAMEDESGLTCAVCQEGRTLQPTELLGLYAYIKKVSIPCNKGGFRGSIDGALLLLTLPYSLPASLRGTDVEDDWFRPAKSASTALKSTDHGAQTLTAAASSSMSSRPSYFLTTVTAGNAIHCTCHARARTADRNHPKAPKSEWEGASLRNSRVSCNVVLPLVSQKNSKVPVMSLENAIQDHNEIASKLLGTQPKPMLWTMLHDVRLLLLRMSYGEKLNIDCGGGSLTSNSALIYYMLFMADLFARDAEHDSPGAVHHAKHLTSGFLAASSILRASDYKDESITSQRMRRGLADAAPMISICCILFNNDPTSSDSLSLSSFENKKCVKNKNSSGDVASNSKRCWELHKDHFLCALIRCAGRRQALGIDSSGCESSRGHSLGRRTRSASFNEWDSSPEQDRRGSSSMTGGRNQIGKRGSSSTVEDHATALRPMITLFAVLDQISKDFTLNMEDETVEEAAERLVHIVEKCQRANNIRSLLSIVNVSMEDKKIIEEIEAGRKTVQ